MARALECPACGRRHRLETIPEAATFRCEQCGQVLKAPAAVSSRPGGPAPPSRGSAPPASAAAAAAASPQLRRTADVPDVPDAEGSTRDVPVRTAAAVSATVAATAAADDVNGAGGSGRGGRRGAPVAASSASTSPKRSKAHWYWRVLAWIVAVPLGFLVTAWPAYELGFIKKDDLLDIFVGTGMGRYLRLAIVTVVWAVVTALLVQLFVEGGRARANRRRRARAASA